MSHFDSKWVDTFQGMRGRWKTYFPITKEGEYRPSFRIFHPLAAGECPHDNYIVESASVSRQFHYKDGTKSDQYITAYVYCEDCETNGEITFSAARDSLQKEFRWIDWNTQRYGITMVIDENGMPVPKAVVY